MMLRLHGGWWRVVSLLMLGSLVLAGCVAPTVSDTAGDMASVEAGRVDAETSTLMPVDLAGRTLRVVATTTLVGDVAAQVGGEHIALVTLLEPGVDPHAYQLTPGDRQQLEDADVILLNGLALEEGMLPVLDELDARVPVVSVNVGVDTIEFGDDRHAEDAHADETHEEGDHAEDHTDEQEAEHEDEAHAEEEAHDEHHHHEGADPHTWQSVPNVIVWTENIANAFSALDPDHAADYAAAGEAYRAELEALDHELHTLAETLPREARKLVTDHDSLGYFAHHYGFTVIGTVIPGLSTLAAASAQELAALQTQIEAEAVRAIFVGTTVDPGLAGQLATDLGIAVVPIYTDALSGADGPAATYVAFMRYNMQTIVDALSE